ncbi:MAG: hypothetical protein ACKVRP_12570, partial [Bacteroidota bacterium]
LKNSFISSGPLSSSHANFEAECSKCHKDFGGAADANCKMCHEKTNDKLGVYTFPAHYLYRSENPARISDAKARNKTKEKMCAECHLEHQGRDALITIVSDTKCAACHYTSLTADHPEFEFARMGVPDDSTLKMSHIRHTKLVMKEINTPNIETACLYCHNAQPDGKHFKPLDFDLHCGSAKCHPPVRSSDMFTIKTDASPIGLETLDMIKSRRGPGTIWAFYTNPREFVVEDGKVRKFVIYHRDPWVLENLKQLRKMLYDEAGLSDLLKASEIPSSKQKRKVYTEAIKALRDYVTGLRPITDSTVQFEVSRIDSLLKIAERSAMSPNASLPDSLFRVGLPTVNPNVERLARLLANPCRKCHELERAGILSVDAVQQTLVRAQFDHRAHILHRACYECHDVIPIADALSLDSVVAAKASVKVSMLDVAATHNLPTKENCIECHNPDSGSNACITCHFMHPNKENRGNLQLFVERP